MIGNPDVFGVYAHPVVWRGSRRGVDVVFGNVRDAGWLTEDLEAGLHRCRQPARDDEAQQREQLGVDLTRGEQLLDELLGLPRELVSLLVGEACEALAERLVRVLELRRLCRLSALH